MYQQEPRGTSKPPQHNEGKGPPAKVLEDISPGVTRGLSTEEIEQLLNISKGRPGWSREAKKRIALKARLETQECETKGKVGKMSGQAPGEERGDLVPETPLQAPQ